MGPGIGEPDIRVLKDMAQCSVVRGQDGAGILQGAVYTKSSHHTVEKTGYEISWLMWHHRTQKGGDRSLFDHPADNFYAVHVRAATKGAILKANAHPFEFSNIVGMHNGTLKDNKYDPKATGKTDSELMFADMNDRGIKAVLSELNSGSAFAVVVYDKKKRKFSFARNDLRPLWVCWNKNRRVMYWASELGMLEWILDRNGIKHSDPNYLQPGWVYELDPLDVNVGKKPDWIAYEINPIKLPVSTYTPPSKIVAAKDFREFNLQQQPKLTVIHSDVRPEVQDNKPSPLPEQQKAKEKDQKRAAIRAEDATQSGQGKNRRTLPRATLHVTCTGCGKDMDLLDRYQGNEINANLWLCKKCDDGMDDLRRMKFLM